MADGKFLSNSDPDDGAAVAPQSGDGAEDAEHFERFVALLAHDLRNPVAAADSGLKLLRHQGLDARALRIVDLIQESLDRMNVLIDEVVDMARGRLDAIVPVSPIISIDLEPVLRQAVADSLASASMDEVAVRIDFDQPVRCDPVRLAQLTSNLVLTAVARATPGTPLEVTGRTAEDALDLAISYRGAGGRAPTIEQLCRPVRGSDGAHGGRASSLLLASEIARAHGGKLSVAGLDGLTRITFRMPLR